MIGENHLVFLFIILYVTIFFFKFLRIIKDLNKSEMLLLLLFITQIFGFEIVNFNIALKQKNLYLLERGLIRYLMQILNILNILIIADLKRFSITK